MHYIPRIPYKMEAALELTAGQHKKSWQGFISRLKGAIVIAIPFHLLTRVTGRYLTLFSSSHALVHKWTFTNGSVAYSDSLIWVALLDDDGDPFIPF